MYISRVAGPSCDVVTKFGKLPALLILLLHRAARGAKGRCVKVGNVVGIGLCHPELRGRGEFS
jgi:hypothetical protein